MRLEFVEGDMAKRDEAFRDGEFNVVIDTLAFNNVPPGAGASYLRQVWRVLSGSGTYVLQWRVRRGYHHPLDPVPAEDVLPPSFSRFFKSGPVLPTQLPEWPEGKSERHWADVFVCVAKRREQRG